MAAVAEDPEVERSEAVAAGDVPIFTAFFEREYRGVVGLAAVLSGSWLVAEDLAQEAFAAAHRRWVDVANYESPEAWVRRVVANLAASWVRRRWREARVMVRLGRERGPAWDALEPEHEEFWAAVRALPKRQAQCVALFYFEDRSVPQVAAILKIAQSTVRVHLHKGRVALAVRFGEDADAER